LKAEVEQLVLETYKVPVSDDYVYKTYGIEKPDNYDELKAKQESERLAMSQQRDPAPAPPAPGKPKPKPTDPPQKKLAATNIWRLFREQLADFFDPAP
jgi:hypothetical protein